ncbi:MAG: excinuclease ABC subunit UvrA [Patescibacteria group bacterium]
MDKYIKVRGARQHNLKNIDLDIPKNKLVVFTGVSGSGKSSLAFDTIYAEGQRRYVESLSTYARQFLGIMEKPDMDLIEGISPSISIDQKTTSHNPRSTVGTITEIYDYLRLLFARIGHPHCPICGREISSQSLDQILSKSCDLIESQLKKRKVSRFFVYSRIVFERKGEFSSLFANLKAKGFSQVRIDGHSRDVHEDIVLIKTNKHTIDVAIDKISISLTNLKDKTFKENLTSRLRDSIQTALNLSQGTVILSEILDKVFELPKYPKFFKDYLFSERFSCPVDNVEIPEIEPRSFSFNSPQGACPGCRGIGKILKVEPMSVFSSSISISEGGILPFSALFENDTWYSRLILTVCKENAIDARRPISNLTKKQKDNILYGTGNKEYKVKGTNRMGNTTYIWETFSGIIPELEKRHSETNSDFVRWEIEKYMRENVCKSCNGARLKPGSLSISLDSKSISDITSYSIKDCLSWVSSLAQRKVLSLKEEEISTLIIREIESRLSFLLSVGLEYLTLSREGATLSGGEAQRIRLASQIGSGLTGVLYVLDEPTIGLHPKDNAKLILTLKKLVNLGNSVIVVEHDREMISAADYVFDFGPGAGKNGGKIVSCGSPGQIANDQNSLTGKYLSGKNKIEFTPLKTDLNNPKTVKIYGCKQFNLKNIDVSFPLERFIVVTGVSGSGKSTLVVETLFPAIAQSLNPFFKGNIGIFSRIDGLENIDKIILVDQSPIGRTPRSNPATYTKVFDEIRNIYSQTRESRFHGFKKGRFSFNVKGGRCESCEGAGQTKIEMQFMSDIWVKCDVCKGTRYNSQTLEVNFKGKNISEVLNLSVKEAADFFQGLPKLESKLATLEEVGLSYIELGQPATTLSGGEAQRVKLSTELSKRSSGRTLYILDEPTTGLHFADVARLIKILKILVSRGNSVLVIEHNLDVIKNSDWVIDLGLEGGDLGGYLVADGTPKKIASTPSSYTGTYLAKVL